MEISQHSHICAWWIIDDRAWLGTTLRWCNLPLLYVVARSREPWSWDRFTHSILASTKFNFSATTAKKQTTTYFLALQWSMQLDPSQQADSFYLMLMPHIQGAFWPPPILMWKSSWGCWAECFSAPEDILKSARRAFGPALSLTIDPS